jgi:hypothetical protein
MSFRATTATAALAALALSVTGCGTRYVRSGPNPVVLTATTNPSLSQHVVLISVDGLRPDAIGRFAAPTIQTLMREGSYTLNARTITPSKTLPSHTSMLTGEPPERHGVLWNDVLSAQTDLIESPTIFSIARSNGYGTAAFFSKSKFQSLQRPGTLDYSQAPGGWFGRWASERTVRDVETHLATAQPNVLFIHLSDVDRAGHSAGWMSPAYGHAVIVADAAIRRIIAAADRAYGIGRYTLILTADHGGHDRNHGSDDARDVTIPWIAWGLGVSPGHLSGPAVRTMDTAGPVLWLLGLYEPGDRIGVPVLEAFITPPPRQAMPQTSTR